MLNKEKITSNFDSSLIDEEQLFTELTSEKAAVIEGGNTLRLDSIKAIKAGGDLFGKDEPYLRLDGNKIWAGKMKKGQTKTIDKAVFQGSGIKTFLLFDDDPVFDDFMGSVNINVSQVGLKQQKVFRWRVNGRLAKYRLTFSVLPPIP